MTLKKKGGSIGGILLKLILYFCISVGIYIGIAFLVGYIAISSPSAFLILLGVLFLTPPFAIMILLILTAMLYYTFR